MLIVKIKKKEEKKKIYTKKTINTIIFFKKKQVYQHRFNIINPIQSKFKIFFILKENQIKFNKVDYIILYIYIYIYI
jgi:hypothetical protein